MEEGSLQGWLKWKPSVMPFQGFFRSSSEKEKKGRAFCRQKCVGLPAYSALAGVEKRAAENKGVDVGSLSCHGFFSFFSSFNLSVGEVGLCLLCSLRSWCDFLPNSLRTLRFVRNDPLVDDLASPKSTCLDKAGRHSCHFRNSGSVYLQSKNSRKSENLIGADFQVEWEQHVLLKLREHILSDPQRAALFWQV